MHHTEPVTFQRAETKRRETYEEDFDLLLYSALCDAREVILHILQDRTLPNGVREPAGIRYAHDMQRRIDQGELFACQEVLEKYQREAARQFAAKRMCEEGADAGRSFAVAKKNFPGGFFSLSCSGRSGTYSFWRWSSFYFWDTRRRVCACYGGFSKLACRKLSGVGDSEGTASRIFCEYIFLRRRLRRTGIFQRKWRCSARRRSGKS